jgi:hypothetical protein
LFILVLKGCKVQTYVCTLLFLVVLVVSCSKSSTNKHFYYQTNVLSKFEEGDFFKINETVIIHSQNYLFNKSNKDTIWVPTNTHIAKKAPIKGQIDLIDRISNTGIMYFLAGEIEKFNITKITSVQTISTQGYITMGANLNITSNNNYSKKVKIWSK